MRVVRAGDTATPHHRLYVPKNRKLYVPKKRTRVVRKKIEVPEQRQEGQVRYAEDVEVKRVPYILKRWPQTNEELWLFVKATWGVEIPYRRVCPDHVAPFQAFADAFFARYPVCIWKASRGFGGKTFLLSLLGSTEMVALKCLVTILGGSSDQSVRVHESMKSFFDYEGSPDYLVEKMTRFDTYLTNGANARTLTASQKSVRGPHPQRLRLDEIDEMDWEILTAAQGQPMRTKRLPGVDTNTVMSSTHQYPDGTMTKMLQIAEDSGFPVYHWCYRETSAAGGWLAKSEIRRKKKEVTKNMWDNEYELQEPSFEGRAVDQDAVSRMFDPALGTVPGHPTKYYEFQEPRDDRDYITGVDWAQQKHFTVVWTFDVTQVPWVCVAFQRFNKMPWPRIIHLANLRMERFGGKLIHDSTGMGTVIKDLIVVSNFMTRRDVKDQIMAGRERHEMLNAYIIAIESDLIRCPRILWAFNEHRFATDEDLFGNGHLPDSFAAGALAWHMRKKSLKKDQIVPPDMHQSLVRADPWDVFGIDMAGMY